MLHKVYSAARHGLDMVGIIVEVNVANRGMSYFDIVGLPNKSIEESKLRVKTALLNIGVEFPVHRITINLAPADMPKEGSFYDLPIAAGILASIYNFKIPADALFFGELSLDGGLVRTRGIFAFSLYAAEKGFKHIFIPAGNVSEVYSDDVSVHAIENLGGLIVMLQDFDKYASQISLSQKLCIDIAEEKSPGLDMSYIYGQETAKRVLEISAAGSHNVLLIGPPGSGKSVLARSFMTIQPELSAKESVEVTKIHSMSTNGNFTGGIIKRRVLRSPHHTISYTGMLGGGINPKPGEITLAHRGVLFMDEFTQYSKYVIESLRQPMEDGFIKIVRGNSAFQFPCQFMLIAATNPCTCGYYGDDTHKCICTPSMLSAYKSKISGPVLDRFDMIIYVKNPEMSNVRLGHNNGKNVENSGDIRQRVTSASKIQQERFKASGIYNNSAMDAEELQKYCRLDTQEEAFLKKTGERLGLSMRGVSKILKVSRTIADLDHSINIRNCHIGEALQYRNYLS